MSETTSPSTSQQSVADGVRIKRLERELAESKSLHTKALDDIDNLETTIAGKDNLVQSLIAAKLHYDAEFEAALANNNRPEVSGNESRQAGPVPPQTTKTQELTNSPAPPTATSAAKIVSRPSSSPSITPSTSEQIGGEIKKQSVVPWASLSISSARDKLKTAAEVVATRRDPNWTVVDDYLLELERIPPPPPGETAYDIFHKEKRRKEAAAEEAAAKDPPPKPLAHGVGGDSTNKRFTTATEHSDEELDKDSANKHLDDGQQSSAAKLNVSEFSIETRDENSKRKWSEVDDFDSDEPTLASKASDRW